ncbi:MAG: type 4b pilus protein PilO2 [Plesiomonas shigelloides]
MKLIRRKKNSIQRDKSIVEINGVFFTAGLRWVPLNSPLNYMKEARAYGKKHGMDIVAIRKTERTLQAGYVKRGRNHPKVLYSLATVLAGEIKGSFCGVFSIPANDNHREKYYLLAVKDGAIAPFSDVLFDSPDEAVKEAQELLNHYAPGDLDCVYAPDDFCLGDKAISLSDFLQPSVLKREYRVKSLTLGLSKKELLLLGVICLVVGGSGYGWHQYQSAKEAKRIHAEQLQEIERLRIEEQTRQRVESLDLPWVRQPGFIPALTACYDQLKNMPLSIGGWMFADAQCVVASGQVESRFVRQGNATVNDVIHAVKGNVIVTGFDSISVVSPLTALYPGGDDVSAQRVNDLTSFFQRRNIRVEIKPGQHKQDVDNQGNPLPPPKWRFYLLSVDSPISPLALFSDATLSGVRLQSITVSLSPDTAKLTWNIQGVIYEK